MKLLFISDAKVIKLLFIMLIASSCNMKLFSKKPEAKADPISEAIQQKKDEKQQLGMKLAGDEKKKFAKINKRTEISKKQKEARIKYKSGQKISLMDRYRLARANRKDYVRNKKTEKYKHKIIKRRQNKELQKKLKADRKRIKKRDRRARREQRWKSFINLFR